MKKFDIQLFADEANAKTAVSGKKIVYLYRILENAASKAAAALAFTTENTRTKSKDADTTETKDGAIRTPGATEVEISATSILSKGDTLIEDLEAAMDGNKLIEIWEANLEEPVGQGDTNTQFKGRYFQGYLTEFEQTSAAEDFVECSLTFGINGAGVKGNVTVTAEQQAVAEYAFKDTTSTGA